MSQIISGYPRVDGSYPIMGYDGAVFGVQYVQQSIRFASDLGCPESRYNR
ncbi:MAG: hypothetical protein U5N58_06115 [Actinomycetota bacterium]|nr:hypothetical protein [Actinomycetota bacterium]